MKEIMRSDKFYTIFEPHSSVDESSVPQIVENAPPTPMEEQQAQHLTELLTVTNDMGKIDNFRPDPNDVSNVVIEGTDTAHLIRECVLCHKKVLGKTK